MLHSSGFRIDIGDRWIHDVRTLLNTRKQKPRHDAINFLDLLAPIDVIVDRVNTTELLPDDRPFPFLSRLVGAVVRIAHHGQSTATVAFDESPWEIAITCDASGQVVVAVCSFVAAQVAARSLPMSPQQLVDSVRQTVDAVCAELAQLPDFLERKTMQAELASLQASLQAPAVVFARAAEPRLPAEHSRLIETRSEGGLALVTELQLAGSALMAYRGDLPLDTHCLLVEGTLSMLPDGGAGVRLEGHPIAMLEAFVVALGERMEAPAARDSRMLQLRGNKGSVQWEASARRLVGVGLLNNDGQPWQYGCDPVEAVQLVLEHTARLVEQCYNVNPHTAANERLELLRSSAEALRRRLVRARGHMRGTSVVATPPQIRWSPEHGDVESLRHVRVVWAWARKLEGRPHVEAWPQNEAWLLRVGAEINSTQLRDGALQWRFPTSTVLNAPRHVVAGACIFGAVPEASGARTQSDVVLGWIDAADGLVVEGTTVAVESLRAILPVSGDGGIEAAAVTRSGLVLVDHGGRVERIEARFERPRLTRAGMCVVAAVGGNPGLVVGIRQGALRPIWEVPIDAERIDLLALGDVVAAVAVRYLARSSSLLLIDARSGALIARHDEPSPLHNHGRLEDGRPFWLFGHRTPESVVVLRLDGGGFERAEFAPELLPDGDLSALVVSGRILVCGAEQVRAFAPSDPGRTLWRAPVRVDRSGLRGFVLPAHTDTVALPGDDVIVWLSVHDGRVVASLPRLAEAIHAAYLDADGNLLVVDADRSALTLRAANVTGHLRVLPATRERNPG